MSTGQLALLQSLIVAVRVHDIGNQVLDHVAEIIREFPVQCAEILSYRALKAWLMHPDHDGCAPLSGIAIRLDVMLAAERHKNPHRPDIRQRILQFSFSVGFALFAWFLANPGLQAITCRTRRRTFPRRRAPRKQRLKLRKLILNGLVAWSMMRSERALPETDFRRCVRNWVGQVRSFG